jgi:hypothetical protein
MGLYALRLLDQRVVRAGFDHLALGAGFAEPGLEPQVFGGAQQHACVYGVAGGHAQLVGQRLRVGGKLVETGGRWRTAPRAIPGLGLFAVALPRSPTLRARARAPQILLLP